MLCLDWSIGSLNGNRTERAIQGMSGSSPLLSGSHISPMAFDIDADHARTDTTASTMLATRLHDLLHIIRSYIFDSGIIISGMARQSTSSLIQAPIQVNAQRPTLWVKTRMVKVWWLKQAPTVTWRPITWRPVKWRPSVLT